MGQVIINDTTMEAIADAIRDNLNTTSDYKPSEMADAIKQIQAPGSSSADDIEVALLEGTITGHYKNEHITILRAYAFYEADNLVSIDLPNVVSAKTGADHNATIRNDGEDTFYGCNNLEEVNLPKLIEVSNGMFDGCSSLAKIDFPLVETINSSAFYGCSSLETLILRYDGVVALTQGNSAFPNTPIEEGTGYIYVPAAHIDAYKVDEAWSAYANQIRAIEDYPDVCGN